MAEHRVERRLAAILAADVAGCSLPMGVDEDGTLAATIAHRTEQIESRVAEHRRRVVKTTGDGLLVEFARGVDAIMAYAVEARLTPRDRNGAGAFWVSRSRKE